jgi:hypothetical protein
MRDALIGRRFGRLLVMSFAGSTHSGSRWSCLCDCGKMTETYGFALKDGATTSCGCRAKECLDLRTTHGGSDLPEYGVWEAMHARCYNKNHESYKNYGAKGVGIYEGWRGPDGFKNFLVDMGRRPSSAHTIERKRSEEGYAPDNCYWATRIEQNNNTSRNHRVTYNGRTQTLAQWGRELGIRAELIRKRLHLGWSVDRAFTEPVSR